MPARRPGGGLIRAQARALVEALLDETIIKAVDSLEDKRFRKQLREIKKTNPRLFYKIVRKYKRWRAKPESVNFEPKHSGLYAVELPKGHHAVCDFDGKIVTWRFIGPYDDYKKYLDDAR
jgi:hypothetical protein